jgi:hypothetical protein
MFAKRLGFLLIFLIFCSAAGAQPEITSVSGKFENGQTIVITGSGFSNKSQAAPLLSSYDDATPSNNWSTGSIGGLWTERDNDGTGDLSTGDIERTSLYQSSYNFRYDAASGYNSIRYQHNTVEPVMYCSFWIYRDNATLNLASIDMNSKFFRMYTNAGEVANVVWSVVDDDSEGIDIYKAYIAGDYLGTNAYTIDYTAPVCLSTAGNPTMLAPGSKLTAAKPNMGQWEHYEILVEYPSEIGAADARVIALKDGATFARTSQTVRLGEVGQVEAYRFPMAGQVSGGRNESYYEYIDQFYIDNTVAHVYVSDSANASWPDIASFHHSEIQVASEWSDGSITFTYNQGALPPGEVAYVYVVDTDGHCNAQGYNPGLNPPADFRRD